MAISNTVQQDILQHLKACKFRALCDKYFASQFKWTIKGTSVLSGTYNDIDDFFARVITPLSNLIEPGWTMEILNSYVTDTAMIIEMKGSAKLKAGGTYNNEYCWILHFENEQLIAVTAYYDSLLVNQTLAS